MDLKSIQKMLSPREAADLLGLLKIDCVIEAIAAGDLAASNVGMGKKRPTWRILPQDLAAFIERRRFTPAVARQRTKTASRHATGTDTAYFK